MRHNPRSPENRKTAAERHRSINARLRRINSGAVAVKEISEGDVVWARQEFLDRHESKIRPMVVVAVNDNSLTVRRVTTQNQHKRHTETPPVPLGRRSWLSDEIETIDLQRVIDLAH